MNIPPGFAQINFNFTGIALPRGAQVVIGVENEVPATTAIAVATLGGNAWSAGLLDTQSVNVTLDSVRAKLGPNDTGPEAVVSFGENGGNGSSPDAPQVAVLVRKNAALGGRSNRGRMFIPGLVEDQTISGGLIAPASLDVWQTAVNGFMAALTGFGIPMVILHNSVELTPTTVAGLSVQQLVATQRRRLRRVGSRRSGPPP